MFRSCRFPYIKLSFVLSFFLSLSVPIQNFARKTYKQIGSSHNGEQSSSSAGCCHGGRGFLAVGSVRFDWCDLSPDPCHKFTASPRIFAAMLTSIPAAESADMGDSSAADSAGGNRGEDAFAADCSVPPQDCAEHPRRALLLSARRRGRPQWY